MAGTVKRSRKYYEPPMSPHTAELDPNTGLPRSTNVGRGVGSTNPRIKTPAVAGVRSPDVKPFQRPEDMMNVADRQAAMREAMFNIDNQLEQMRAQTQYDTGQIDKQATYGKRDTNDAMAARGLSQSSIKDGEIFDIEATARTRKEFLNSQLALADAQGQATKLRLGDDFARFMDAMNKQMVANADEVSANTPEWLVKPQAAVMQPYKSVVKDGKFYRVYNDGKNASDWQYIRPASK